MKVLIVGAGALGRVFGGLLARGGASVSVLVKPGQRTAAEHGFQLWQLRKVRSDVPIQFSPVRVFTDSTEVAGDWDCVWLCVHSTAFGDGWLETLRARSGWASIVSIAQGVSDRAALERHWPAEQILELVPAVFAFEEHVHGERTLFWIPPGAALQVAGDRARAERVIEVLRCGGFAARYAGAHGNGSLLAALNIPYFAALETVDWSFRRLERQLAPPAAAAREAAAAVAKASSAVAPPALATSPRIVQLGFGVLRRLAPFDFDDYARRHFAKIGAQTRAMLDQWIATAHAHGLPSENLERLRTSMPALAPRPSPRASDAAAQAGGTNAS